MGMFDEVEVQYPLPDGYEGHLFQTKDLDCQLDLYRISAAGALSKGSWDKDAQVWGNFQPVPFHGMLNFYITDPSGKWREYCAKFTDGVLVEITAVLSARSSSNAA